MSEDQHFALSRPDVVTFTKDYSTEDVTLAGEIMAKLKISATSTDADFIVKLIDIYPADEPQNADKRNVLYANYHQIVRSEVTRARFRNSYEKPEALTPNQTTNINFRLQDVLHTFKKGHKIQVQIQSTWYSMAALNSQKYIDNQNLREKEDNPKSFIKILNSSSLEVEIIKQILKSCHERHLLLFDY
jgi:hypothetical protein